MVYVDVPRYKFKRMTMGHMWADSVEELHKFALLALGLKKEWFQNHKRFPHYDISTNKYYQALRFGATRMELKDMNLKKERL
jgi:hypothetical protein